jgi:hypothetical protein
VAGTGSGYEVKSATVRAHLAQTEKLGPIARVLEHMPPESRAVLESLPLPSAWLDGWALTELMIAVERVHGISGLRTMTMRAQQTSTTPLLMPIVGGLLRVFGTSPDTLLSRFGDLVKTQLRGVSLVWTRDSPRAGRLSVRYPRAHMPPAAFVGFESGCRGILDLCGYKGTVASAEVVAASGGGTAGTIRVEWIK